jgi:hypothetical protein
VDIVVTVVAWILGIYVVGFATTWALLSSNHDTHSNSENVLIALVWPIALYVAITELINR